MSKEKKEPLYEEENERELLEKLADVLLNLWLEGELEGGDTD